jgi:hypothetical protein
VNLAKNKVHRHNDLCTKDLIERVDLVNLVATPDASYALPRGVLDRYRGRDEAGERCRRGPVHHRVDRAMMASVDHTGARNGLVSRQRFD